MKLKDINITTEDMFESLALAFQSPMRASYILSDCLEQERANYLAQFLNERADIILASAFGSPKDLFDFLKAKQQATIYFEDEILSKRIEYIRLLEGAICSNDLEKPWRVSHETDSFEFKGKVLIASRLSKEELKKREQLHKILRDSVVM